MPGAGSAAVTSPVARPAQRCAAFDHCTVKVRASRELAPCRCSVADPGSVGQAAHGRSTYFDVARAKLALRAAKETHQPVTGSNATGCWTGVPIPAFTINFTGCNSSQPHTWPLGAPNRPVAVPYGSWSAGEGLTGWDYGGGGK